MRQFEYPAVANWILTMLLSKLQRRRDLYIQQVWYSQKILSMGSMSRSNAAGYELINKWKPGSELDVLLLNGICGTFHRAGKLRVRMGSCLLVWQSGEREAGS